MRARAGAGRPLARQPPEARARGLLYRIVGVRLRVALASPRSVAAAPTGVDYIRTCTRGARGWAPLQTAHKNRSLHSPFLLLSADLKVLSELYDSSSWGALTRCCLDQSWAVAGSSCMCPHAELSYYRYTRTQQDSTPRSATHRSGCGVTVHLAFNLMASCSLYISYVARRVNDRLHVLASPIATCHAPPGARRPQVRRGLSGSPSDRWQDPGSTALDYQFQSREVSRV